MIGLPFQVQALLGGQGAAGLLALLGGGGGGAGGSASPSSTPFGALLAQLNMTDGPQALTATAAPAALSSLMVSGSELASIAPLLGNNGPQLISTEALFALGDLQDALPGFLSTGKIEAADASDPTAAVLPFLAALVAAVPQQNASLPTTMGVTADTANNSDDKAKPMASADLLARLAEGLEPLVSFGGTEEPGGLAQSQSNNKNNNLSPKAATADAIRAAHEAGMTGIELAGIAGGRALAKGIGATTAAASSDPLDDGAEFDASSLADDGLATRANTVIKPAHHGASALSWTAREAGAIANALNASTAVKPENAAVTALRVLAMGDAKAPGHDAVDALLSDTTIQAGGSMEAPLTPGAFLSHLTTRPLSVSNFTAPMAAHVASQVAVHIGQALRNGQNEFNIRLDPPELGRIDVKLEMHQDGRVSAILAADNEQTLQLFERHQGLLERALQDAGLKADAGSLSFTLSGGDKDAKSGLTAQSDGSADNLDADAEAAADDIIAVATLSDRALDILV